MPLFPQSLDVLLAVSEMLPRLQHLAQQVMQAGGACTLSDDLLAAVHYLEGAHDLAIAALSSADPLPVLARSIAA